jgi:streptogramin lyase
MKETVERYSLAGSIQTGPYLFQELGISFNDIAYEGGDGYGDIWWACNDSAYPVRVYNTAGTLVYSIPSSVIPAAHGICFDDDGFLWVSNLNAEEIYKIDITGTALERSTWGEIKASVGSL